MEDNLTNISLLSLSKAAALLKIGKETLIDLINQGFIGVVRINHRYKIAYKELERFISENTFYQCSSSSALPLCDGTTVSTPKVNLNYSSDELFNNLKGEFLHG